MSQLDGFFSDASRITDRRIADMQVRGAADREAALTRAANEAIETLKDYNAGNLAMKHLLLKELKKLDPNHPLVRDASLRESIGAAAQKVIRISDNWNDVREFGLNFKVPGR